MLVVEQAQALALNLENPGRVLASIPTARSLSHSGERLVVLPHKYEEVQVLRNLGIKAPAPIMHYYDWSGHHVPYNHQKLTAAFLTMNPKALVLNEIGTGKTQSALWAADYLIKAGAIKKVLILSPLSTLERVWGDDIFTEFFHRQALVLHGSAERRKKLLAMDANFYIINHDGFGIIAEEALGMFDLVIVDEAAIYRNPGTARFKALNWWLQKHNDLMIWLMTGTPTPNEPTDAWALSKLIDSPLCPQTYGRFKMQVMEKHGMWKWVPKAGSMDMVQHILQPAVRYTRDECFDLPDTVVQTREAKLSKQQREHYDTMMKQLIVESANGTITAANEAVKAQKLVQIACGVAYNDQGENVELDCSPRVSLVKDVIREAGEKIIVFVPLTGTLKMLERELSKEWTVGVVNGAVSASKRNVIFKNFQDTKDPHVLIAHPATMAHGLTLTSASTIIWYGPIYSNEQYVQANGRIERIGKRHVSNVVHIVGTTLERNIYTRLQGKQKLQGLLLELIRNSTEGT